MRKILNPYTALYAVGVLQPAAVNEFRGFLVETFTEVGDDLLISDLQMFLDEQVKEGRVVISDWDERRLYSLTEHGNRYLSLQLRKLRDKFRVYLLRDAHRRKVKKSRIGGITGLVGASPTVDASSTLKVSATNKLGSLSVTRANQVYWPRSSRQFQLETGPVDPIRDTYLPWISYLSLTDLNAARDEATAPHFDFVGLGLCLGLSPGLILKLAYSPARYYRRFSLPKKGGGERIIRSPRLFLKVVQWFLAEFVLNSLPISHAVHSFRHDRSIVTNALAHERRPFVANIDIEDFFGSISRRRVAAFLRKKGFQDSEANAISRLVTIADCLPQGAPTSPTISNAILANFDEMMLRYSKRAGIVYTRYADDMTLSSDSKERLQLAIEAAKRGLLRYGLRLNDKKTRIASRAGQQRVTGVVVNEKSAPPRALRRKIRAIFHQAGIDPGNYSERVSELGGYIGYLSQFPYFSDAAIVNEYRSVLRRVRAIRRIRVLQARAVAIDSKGFVLTSLIQTRSSADP